MIIESDGDGGWFITDIDHLHASVHLTEEWLDEYERHQGEQPRLRWLLKSGGDVTQDDVKRTFAGRREAAKRRAPDAALREWRRGRRAADSDR